MLLWDGACARQTHDIEGFVSPDYRVFEPTPRVEPSFIDYAMQGPHLRRAFRNAARGTNKRRNRIGRGDFRRIAVPLPPLPEQRRIADILGAVDRAIDATRAVIEQTRRVKAGLLQELLTRGVGPDGRPHQRLKDSPIGPVPAEWRVEPLSAALLGIEAGRNPAAPNSPASTDQWGVLKVSAIGHGRFHPGENKVLPDDYEVARLHRVRAGDVLITRANTAALVGACCRVPPGDYRLMLSDKTLRLVADTSCLMSSFLALYMAAPSVRGYFAVAATGSSASMKNLSQGKITRLPIPLPPLDEQHRIVTILDAVDAELRAEQTKHTHLTTLKAGLLQDLLSGTVRVKP